MSDRAPVRSRGDVKPESGSGFQVMLNGQIESGELVQFRGRDNLFCRFTYAYGPDWRMIHASSEEHEKAFSDYMLQGDAQGYSQVVQKGGATDASIVWNFPIEAIWKSTNPQGWPRLVVSVYSQDLFGRYVPAGYGSIAIPTMPGKYTRQIRMFTPVSSTIIQSILGWITGNQPEFFDSKFVASNEGREVTRVQATGRVTVQLNVVTRGMATYGYTTGAPPDTLDLDADDKLGATMGFGMLPTLASVKGGTGEGERVDRKAQLQAHQRALAAVGMSMSTRADKVPESTTAGGLGLGATVSLAATRNTVVGPLSTTTTALGGTVPAAEIAPSTTAAARRSTSKPPSDATDAETKVDATANTTQVTAVNKPVKDTGRSLRRHQIKQSTFPLDETVTPSAAPDVTTATTTTTTTTTASRRGPKLAEATVADEGEELVPAPRRPPTSGSATPGRPQEIKPVDAVEAGGQSGIAFVRSSKIPRDSDGKSRD